ncbi:MAG: glycoside hydrolase superfamily [Monoraphidium minutum]|nr:MAG: glycoside hydrolase superfamily [Monoraphidium minutum]
MRCSRIVVLALVTVAMAGAAGAPAGKGAWWRPDLDMKFQYQLSVAMDPDKHFIPGVQVYFIDGFDTPAEVVAALKAKGNDTWPVIPVCYISAGTVEDWRPDAAEFTEEDKGAPLLDWEGEAWVNTRSDNVRRIMHKRLEMCRDKGFPAVDPDNVNAYTNPNALGLTAADQLDYNRWLADSAHELGLAVGLKNDLEQLRQLAPHFDFFVNEQCHVYNECGMYAPVKAAKKPIWGIEYEPGAFKVACKNATRSGIQPIFKKIDLNACRQDCDSKTLECPKDGDQGAAGSGEEGPEAFANAGGSAAAPARAWARLLPLAAALALARALVL